MTETVSTTVQAAPKVPVTASTYATGVRQARMAKKYGRVAMAAALGVTVPEWWALENNVLPPAEHAALLKRIAALPLGTSKVGAVPQQYQAPVSVERKPTARKPRTAKKA